MKSRRMKRGKSRKSRKGGSKYFYPYNTKPIMFTNVSNKQGGDARGTVFPTFLTNMARDTGYQFQKAYNAGMGKYEPVNPSPLSQNLIKR